MSSIGGNTTTTTTTAAAVTTVFYSGCVTDLLIYFVFEFIIYPSLILMSIFI